MATRSLLQQVRARLEKVAVTETERALALHIDSLERIMIQSGLLLAAPGNPPSAAVVQTVARALLSACPLGRTFAEKVPYGDP